MNKYSKLTVLFTVLYALGFLVYEDLYFSIPPNWIPDFIYNSKTLLYTTIAFPYHLSNALLYLCYSGLSIALVTGFIALKQTYKAKERVKWIVIILTILNTINAFLFIYYSVTGE